MYKKAKNTRPQKDESSSSEGVQYATDEEQRAITNGSGKYDVVGPKLK